MATADLEGFTDDDTDDDVAEASPAMLRGMVKALRASETSSQKKLVDAEASARKAASASFAQRADMQMKADAEKVLMQKAESAARRGARDVAQQLARMELRCLEAEARCERKVVVEDGDGSPSHLLKVDQMKVAADAQRAAQRCTEANERCAAANERCAAAEQRCAAAEFRNTELQRRCAADADALRSTCGALGARVQHLEAMEVGHLEAIDSAASLEMETQDSAASLEASPTTRKRAGSLAGVERAESLANVEPPAFDADLHFAMRLEDIGLDAAVAPRLRALGARRLFDLTYLHDRDLDDIAVNSDHKFMMRRIFGRMRHLVEELEDDTPVPVQKPPTALACFIASPFTTMSPF